MRLLPASLAAIAITPFFVALPTVSFASTDAPHPVAPHVQSTAVRGVDATAKGQLWNRRILRPGHAISTLSPVQERARFTVAGVSWARTTGLTSDDVIVQIRLREATGWTAWETPGVTDEGPQGGTTESTTARLGTNPLVTDGATAIQVRVDTTNGQPLPDVKITTINPGTSAADDDVTAHTPAASAAAAAAMPTIITREQWGADESLRGSTTYNTTVKAITIHHTASSNDYTAATAAAQIRGIYAYDTKGLGWSDIAYNFLVDKFGRVYEGRAGSITSAVRGAHAMGFNTNTMGIAALGNYQTATPPAVMVDAIARTAGWKLSQYGVDPLATTKLTSAGGTGTKYGAGVTATLPTLNAHQNTSYTLCPGKYLYPMMSSIRTKAAAYARTSAPPPPPVVVPTVPAPVSTAKLFATYGKLTLASGSKGYAVRDLQLELNRRGFKAGTADGAFGPTSLGAVQRFQKSFVLTVTGKVAANDWKALSGLAYVKTGAPVTPPVTPPPPTTPPAPPTAPITPTPTAPGPAKAIVGFNADGRGDVIGRTGTGDLYFYPSKVGGIGTPVRFGKGWNIYSQFLSPGDFTGDRIADIIAVTPAGEAYLYKGNGKGGVVGARVLIATNWKAYTDLIAPGDWTGDGKADLLARKANGELWMGVGNGKGGFTGTWRRLATGWQTVAQVITPGDITGDGQADLLGRTAAGKLYLYRGVGIGTDTASGYLPGRLVSTGWQAYNTVFSTGDLTGDGRADLIARTSTNASYVYAGNGKGAFAAPKKIAAPWGATTRITGVR
ncbi:Repeat domain-containing protein [Pedococcus dokdonensis]|uniref:Repeat domain-containing protein n=1 Tax=Pedococcus dokdonensis TaxID=443156 RepID=A0A1H0ME80_9MICO|nr:FG-GAP-like repeat-containing protein [Pedococcus dokdonensis]SDO78576.1 Repeat domain-containing protein [Pedococcus dokdonensis]